LVDRGLSEDSLLLTDASQGNCLRIGFVESCATSSLETVSLTRGMLVRLFLRFLHPDH